MLNKSVIAAATMAGALVLAPGQGRAQTMPPTITVGMDVDAGTLDPRLSRDTTAYRAIDMIYDGLVHLSPTLEPKPNLATSWENPDPKTWIFHLRDGVKFQDGQPLTAADVVFTFATILDPKLNAPQRALYTPIQSVEAVDPKTVKFTLSAPYAPLLTYLDMGIVPKHVVDAGGDLSQKPVGTGPMKLASWNKGSRITLTPNPDFWGGAPAVKELRLAIIGDNTARAQAFEAGDLDLIMSPLSPQDIKRLTANSKFANAIASGLGVTYLNFNTSDPLLADPAMRRAFSMLVDQKTILGQIYEGMDKVASSVLLPSSWAYSDAVKQPPFDVDGAKKAFAALGWKPGSDGILAKDGKKLSIVLSTHSEDPNRIQTAEYMQSIFQSVGIDVKLRISDFASFSTNYVQQSQHQIALLGWLNIVDPDRLLYGQLRTGGSTNWGKYSNPKADEALDKGRTSLTVADRKAAYQQAAAIIAEDVPYYIMSYQGYQMFYSKALGQLPTDPRGNLRNLLIGK